MESYRKKISENAMSSLTVSSNDYITQKDIHGQQD